jgi:hypothetical protein
MSLDKPVVVIALEPVSAAHLHGVIAAALCGWSGEGPAPELAQIGDGHAAAADWQLALFAGSDRRKIAIAHADLFTWLRLRSEYPRRFEIVYLRPHLLILEDLEWTPKVDGQIGRFRRKLLLDLDRRLSQFPVLGVEALFHAPQATADILAAHCGVTPSPTDPAEDGVRARYLSSLTAVLHLTHDAPFARVTGLSGFAVGQTYAIRPLSPGGLALDRGWAFDEDGKVCRSVGGNARLLLPLAPDVPKTELWLRLELDAVSPPAVRVRIGGEPAETVAEPGALGGITLTTRLRRPAADAIFCVDIEFGADGDEPPGEISLQSFRIEQGSMWSRLTSRLRSSGSRTGAAPDFKAARRGGAGAGTSMRLARGLDRYIGAHMPGSAIAVAIPDNGSTADLPLILAGCGLKGLLVLADASASNDLPAALQRGPAPRAEAPATLQVVRLGGEWPMMLAEVERHLGWPDLIIMEDGNLRPIFEAVTAIAEPRHLGMPDFLIFTRDPGLLSDTYWTNRQAVQTAVYPDWIEEQTGHTEDPLVAAGAHVHVHAEFIYIRRSPD